MKKIYVSEITLNALKEQDLTFREKLAISEKLDNAKVDFVELPALSDNKENEIIYRTICENLSNATVSVNVGADDESFELAVKCVKNAKKACLQVALPISTTLSGMKNNQAALEYTNKPIILQRLKKY